MTYVYIYNRCETVYIILYRYTKIPNIDVDISTAVHATMALSAVINEGTRMLLCVCVCVWARSVLRWCAVAMVARQPTRTSRNHGRLTGTRTRGRDVGRATETVVWTTRGRVCVYTCACVRLQATEPASYETLLATDLTDAAAVDRRQYARCTL